MVFKNFHSDLDSYKNDSENATRLILSELAEALVKDKENFIEVLRSADINVYNGSTDAQLIDLFVNNAPNNKQLLLGASLLVNHRNSTTNFDGEEELSDKGVKQSYYALDDYFNASGDEESSNMDWAATIKTIADVGGGITNKVMDSQESKKRGVSNALAKQQDARKEMINNVLAQRQKESEIKLQEKAKTKKALIIGGSVLVAVLIGVGIYFMVKKK